MARNYSKGKKPEETMRQRQRRLLKEQQARKAAQTNVKSTPDPNPAKRGAQGPRNPSKQGPYRKPVSAMQGNTGRTGSTSRTAPPAPKYKPRVSNVGPQIRQAKAVKVANPGRGARAARNTGTLAKLAKFASNPYSTALTIIGSDIANRSVADGTLKGKPVRSKPGSNAGNYNTRDADGTVRSRKKVGPKKVGPKKVGPKKVGTIAQAFDKSYAAAKKAGKKTFMFRGKKYTTN